MPLGQQIALEPLEPPDRLVEQPADLREVACDGHHLRPQAVLHGGADPLRQGRLEVRRG